MLVPLSRRIDVWEAQEEPDCILLMRDDLD
jgi:hypothetical protein